MSEDHAFWQVKAAVVRDLTHPRLTRMCQVRTMRALPVPWAFKWLYFSMAFCGNMFNIHCRYVRLCRKKSNGPKTSLRQGGQLPFEEKGRVVFNEFLRVRLSCMSEEHRPTAL